MTSRFTLEIDGDRADPPNWRALFDALVSGVDLHQRVEVIEVASHYQTGKEVELGRWTISAQKGH